MPGVAHLFRWLADERPDVLHVHSIKTGTGLPEFREARRLGIRIIATCHLPSLGYLCRTGELMEAGHASMRRHRVAGEMRGVQPDARRSGAAGFRALAGAIPPSVGTVLRAVPGKVGTVLGMSALVVEYQRMQRELFEIVERFVVLNDTAYRMLVADGSPADKIAVNRLGLSQSGVARKPGPGDRPTTKPVHFGFAGRLHHVEGRCRDRARRARDPSQRGFPDRHPRAAARRGRARDRRTSCVVSPGTIHAIHFEPAVNSAEIPAVLTELDALLSPSLWFENGPTIALEAIAVGTPIIATRVGNLAEIDRGWCERAARRSGQRPGAVGGDPRSGDRPSARRSTCGAAASAGADAWTTSRATT